MIFEVILLALASVQAKVTVLLDSTKDSSAGWMLYSSTIQPPTISGWKQEQEGENNSTSYGVCDRNISADVSNWLWTPFMERGRATEITINIAYRISSCWMPFCKEEFVIFLHESESATTQHQLQSWESKDYAELEQIGWFDRNGGGIINIQSFGVNKKGFHLAFRDQGSCLSISSIKVYYKSCPETIIDFIHLPETLINEDGNNRGRVEVEGECVANAATFYGHYGPPKRECEENWNGGSPKWEWKTYGSYCRCKAGYQPDPIKNNVCVPCPIGQFKKEIKFRGDECMQCPPYTEGILPGLEECPCIEGYYRSKDDSADEMCSRPPSSPSNLTVTKVFATTATLSWSPPLDEGNRTDTRYRVSCDTCGSEVVFIPGNETFQQTSVTIKNLYPETSYRFQVFSLNGVSDLVEEEPEYAEILVVTIENKPVHSSRVEELELEVEDLKRKVDRLIDCGGCGDMINPYYN